MSKRLFKRVTTLKKRATKALERVQLMVDDRLTTREEREEILLILQKLRDQVESVADSIPDDYY